MPRCLVCGAEVSRNTVHCRSCGTVQPQRRLGGTIALGVLVGGLVIAALAAILL
ncbi:hypothetical protein ACEWPL_009815 [Roseovarius sp. S1116L3]|uniref:hypothetical protein n=1 Tax=Roseovarius roseus TaxID=3342636 RepID=UPI003726FDFE